MREKYYEILEISAHHSPVPIHMLLLAHFETAAFVTAGAVLLAYILGTIYHERCNGAANNE